MGSSTPLIKTMAFGADPNVGRIVAALGKCTDIPLDPMKVVVRIGKLVVFRKGRRVEFDEAKARRLLSAKEILIDSHVGRGKAEATAYGCDLTHGYIDENAAYYSS